MKKKHYIIIAIAVAIIFSIAIGIVVWRSTYNKIVDQFPRTPFVFSDTNCAEYVTENFMLDKYFLVNEALYKVTWSSNSERVKDGKVSRPEYTNEDVILTASITINDTTYSKDYKVTLIKDNLPADFILPDMQSVEKFYVKDTLTSVRIPYDLRENLSVQSSYDAEAVISKMCTWFNYEEGTRFEFVGVQSNLIGRTYMFKHMAGTAPVGDGFITITTQDDRLASVAISVIEKEYAVNIPTEEAIANVIGDKYHNYLVEAIKVKNDSAWNIYISTVGETVDFRVLAINFATSEIISDNLLASQEVSAWDKPINVIDVSSDGQPQVLEIYNFFKDMMNRAYTNGKEIHDTNITFSGTNGTYNANTSEHFKSVVDWYYNTLNRDMPNGKGGQVQALTNVDWSLDTAFYAEYLDLFVFGKHDTLSKNPCEVVDTIIHEYNHAVFSHINYGSSAGNPEMRAIHEGYADIMLFAMTDNWTFGEELKDTQYIRDYTSSNNVDEYGNPLPESYGDLVWINTNAYKNASILVKVAYQMRQSGLTSEDVARIWYQSMFYGYSSQSSFVHVKNNVLMAAMDLDYSENAINTIKTSFESFGI